MIDACGGRWSAGWHTCIAEEELLWNLTDRSSRKLVSNLCFEGLRVNSACWHSDLCSHQEGGFFSIRYFLLWLGQSGLSVWHFKRSHCCKLQSFSPLLFLLQVTLRHLWLRAFFPLYYFSLCAWANLLTFCSFLCHSCSCLLWLVFLLTHRRETRAFQYRKMTIWL